MIVLKVGGRALTENFEEIMNSIAKAARIGHKLIVIHGGGQEVDHYSQKMNLQPKKIVSPTGVVSRYTDEEELRVVIMVLAGLINKKITHALQRRGINTIGLTGLDGMIVSGKRRERILIVDERGRKRFIEAGFTGQIESVNTSLLVKLHQIFDVVVMSPLIYSNDSPLNVDSDYLASRLACHLTPEHLIFLTDVDGVIIKGTLIREIPISDIDTILSNVGKGMNRKLIHAVEAYKCGVKNTIICSGLTQDPIERALNLEGSVIVNDRKETSPDR